MPYPEDSEHNAPDHSAPGHHLPEKVNSIYNAIMREHPDYGKEKAMKIAWERSGEKHEASAVLSNWQVVGWGNPGDGYDAEESYDPRSLDTGERVRDPGPGFNDPSLGVDVQRFKQGLSQMSDEELQQLLDGQTLNEAAEEFVYDELEKRQNNADQYPQDQPSPGLEDQGLGLGSYGSKWQVVALGEMQQPGGIGATQDVSNPILDGANAEGPSPDNSGNSPEQEQALQTWVNIAVDKLNQGKSPEEITAEIAKEGCPFPAAAVQRAMEQPEKTPEAIDDSIGQDPFNAPPSDDPLNSGQMQGLSQQPAMVSAKVRVVGTTMTGVELERFENLWGDGTVKIALDGGGTVNVAPSAVEAFDAEFKHPVTEIQDFINSMPEVEATIPSIQARLANLDLVRRAVRNTISKVAFSDQVTLESIDASADDEMRALKSLTLDNLTTAKVDLPVFRYNAFGIAQVENVPSFVGNPREAGAIWASESPWIRTASTDDDFHAAAVYYAEGLNMTGEQFNAFVEAATSYIEENRSIEEAPNADLIENEGPAEGIFL